MNNKLIFLSLTLLLAACNFPTATPTPLPAPTVSWTLYPTAESAASSAPTSNGPAALAPTLFPTFAAPSSGTQQPGVFAHGRVTLDGVGLAGVVINRKFNAYPNVAIAITDADGNYEAFIPIPGDEMTSIIPELAGYIFDPPYYYWRHYYGYEDRAFDFVALPTP